MATAWACGSVQSCPHGCGAPEALGEGGVFPLAWALAQQSGEMHSRALRVQEPFMRSTLRPSRLWC